MLEFDPGGHPFSARYRDVYKSRNGAWGEALAVFVDGADLRGRWQGRPLFTVLELGFGLGVNFLATLHAWESDPHRPGRLVFVSIDAVPSLEEALYLSTTSFTTIGYGDVVLGHEWRLLASFEGANGMIIFGWTTALVIAVIQRFYTWHHR